MLRQITIKNLLSFGPITPPLDLRPLNILIGANGSGKSNLIECLSVMASSPKDIGKPIRESGGIQEWIYKSNGAPKSQGSVELVFETPPNTVPHLPPDLGHYVSFGRWGKNSDHMLISSERISKLTDSDDPRFIFDYIAGNSSALLAEAVGGTRTIPIDRLENGQSVLSQFRDPVRHAEFHFLTDFYESIQFYREWNFGRNSPLRSPQPTDLPSKHLMESGENLGVVLNNLRSIARPRIIKALAALFPGIEDFHVEIDSGAARLFLIENGKTIPATRLSDGTLRFLCLVAILCNPYPQGVVVIEEPELGLHPDVIGEVADMLKEASEGTQLIVTTHSDALVDAFSDTPENVVVCENGERGTVMQRLKKDDLDEWLKKYSLGNLWLRGEIGGTRW